MTDLPDTAPAQDRSQDGPPPQAEHALSSLLRRTLRDVPGERIPVGALIDALGDRAYGALLLLFAAPNALPMPPGTSAILGAPLLLIAWQLMLGYAQPWFPGWMRNRTLRRSDLEAMLDRLLPWIARVERLARPRLAILTGWAGERIIGAITLALAIILFLPIPLGNMLPALAICVFGLALLEKDGIAALLATVIAAVSLAVVWAVILVAVKATILIVHEWILSG